VVADRGVVGGGLQTCVLLLLGDIDVRSSSNSVTLLSRLFVPRAPPADAPAGGICSFGGMGRDLGDEAATAAAASVGGGS
jgi:hypothetical protein